MGFVQGLDERLADNRLPNVEKYVRELDGIDRPFYAPAQSTFGYAEVAGVQVPLMNSGCIGCGVRNRLEIDQNRSKSAKIGRNLPEYAEINRNLIKCHQPNFDQI